MIPDSFGLVWLAACSSQIAHCGRSAKRVKCCCIAACSSASLQAASAPAPRVSMICGSPPERSSMPASSYAAIVDSVRARAREGSAAVS